MAGKLNTLYAMLLGAVVCGVARPLVIYVHFGTADSFFMTPSVVIGVAVGMMIGARAVIQDRMSKTVRTGVIYSGGAFLCVAVAGGAVLGFVAMIFGAGPLSVGEVGIAVAASTWTYFTGMCAAGALTGCVCFLFASKRKTSIDPVSNSPKPLLQSGKTNE